MSDWAMDRRETRASGVRRKARNYGADAVSDGGSGPDGGSARGRCDHGANGEPDAGPDGRSDRGDHVR
jgi:hypothetical protein